MRDSSITTINQIESLIQLPDPFQFTIVGKKERYQWLADALKKFTYHRLKKKEKSVVRQYLKKVTALSTAQLTRLITQHKRFGRLITHYAVSARNGFRKKYGPQDVARLIATDVYHHHLSGQATKQILVREHETFHHQAYATISRISVSHLYAIRNHDHQYNSSPAKYRHRTRPTAVNIGTRAQPQPNGRPGYLRVDTVHSGDLNGHKGVYHLNIVDEVTQWEMIATVEGISEYFLKPVIEELLLRFPFHIHEFHSDNGSEYVNHIVAELLTKLYIRFTKSRARHSNDNALVESKNGSVIRKLYGRNHIPAKYAPLLNSFNRTHLNLYLNYHRPCGYAEDAVDKKGKIKKKYTHWITPYEKLKSLPDAPPYLKPGFTFAQLDQIAYAKSDNEFAEEMNRAKVEVFKKMRAG